MANNIIDDTTAIAKRLREITGKTRKAKVVKVDCVHCRDVGWVRSSPSSRWRKVHAGLGTQPEARLLEMTRPARFSQPRPVCFGGGGPQIDPYLFGLAPKLLLRAPEGAIP